MTETAVQDLARGQRRLAGKIAVVTGAGAGIGQGCAQMFAAQGATVIAMDIDAAALEETVAGSGGAIVARAVDLLDEAATQAAIADIGAQFGKIDILVPAAAVSLFHWIEDMTLEHWRLTLQGELDIVFIVTSAAWPWLKKSGSGAIINFASANAYGVIEESPALAHCAGKGGILAMTRQLAMEGAHHGIRANTISPGLIVTQQTRKHMAMDPRFEGAALAHQMVKRLGMPVDVAWCATWLASDEASFVTGTDISVDAGATAY